MSSPEAPSSPVTGSRRDSSAARSGKKSVSETVLKGVGIAKQFILVKAGKTTMTEESKEFVDMLKQFQSSKLELAEAAAKAQSLYNSDASTVEAENQFSSALAKLGSHSKADPGAASTVQAFVPYTLQLQTHRRKFNEQFKQLLLEPVQALMNNEIKKASGLVTQLEVSRLDYDARARQLANLESKPDDDKDKIAAVARLEASTLDYEKVKKDLVDLCAIIESRKNAFLQDQLQEYIKAMYGFYDQSAECVRTKMSGQLAGNNGGAEPEDQFS